MMKKFVFFFLCLLCGVGLFAETLTATYSVEPTTSVSSSGDFPSGSMATYVQTHTTTSQMTSGHSCTFTLVGYEGCRITGITLSMKSNKSAGAGSLSVMVGETTLCEIKNSAFEVWNGEYSTTYVGVKPEMSNDDYTILKDENVVVHIEATENSLYCNGLSVDYERVVEVLTVPLLPEPGRFIASKEISMSCETEDATIYYTLDGGEPITKYTEPFTITETTTVKALSVKGDETSRVVEATYTMVEPSPWKLVTNADALNVGDKVVIVAAESEYAMSTTQNDNYRGRISVVKCEDQLTIDENVQVLTLEEGKVDGTFALNTGSGYLYAASNSSNHLKTKSTKDANGSWKITITDDVASIVAQGANSHNDLRHNAGDSRFSCYSTTTTQENVCLYYKATEMKINKYGYATLFLDKAVAVPEGLTAYYCTVNGTTAVLNEVGEVIPAATGVVLKGEPNTTYTLTNTAEVNGKAEKIEAENRLMGYVVDTNVPMGTDAYYYALNVKNGVVGFFVPQTASDDMTSFTAKANKAYLKLEGGAANVQMLSIRQGMDGDETAVENSLVLPKTEEMVYYDLTGRRVYNPGWGIYIVNGKKMILR